MNLEEAGRQLDAGTFRAFCWMWAQGPRRFDHPAAVDAAAQWRAGYVTDEQATHQARERLGVEGIVA